MSIKIRYFGSLKETLAKSEDEISGNEPISAQKIWKIVNPEMPLPENILVAINMDYAGLNDPVKEGDEVAFFPPVTGG